MPHGPDLDGVVQYRKALCSPMWQRLKPQPFNLCVWPVGLLLALLGYWHVMTAPGLLPNFMFENDRRASFFFGLGLRLAAQQRGPGFRRRGAR